MKKYWAVFRWSFKMQIIWRFDVALTMMTTTGRIVAAWILWSAIFAGKAAVGGFTFESMLSYSVVGAFLASLDMSRQIGFEVSDLIKNGGFSKHMVTPMHPLGFFGAMIAGESSFHLAFSCLAAALCAWLFQMHIALATDAARLALGGGMALLGLVFMAQYQHFIGTLAFRFIDIGFVLHAQGSLLAFATGAMVPLSLLPPAVGDALSLLPFPHIVFTPAMLLTGQMGAEEALFGLAVLLVWVGLMGCIGHISYHRLRTQYEGVGI
jgi:ABC-2 type transport system permease protein